VHNNFPSVASITRADPNPTHAASVNFVVTFSKPVTGVNTSDFTPTVTGGITGASVTGVTGSGTIYTVTVGTGTGSGTLRLDVSDDDSIVDAAGNPLGGTGAGNGDFTSGEAYTVDKNPPSIASITRADTNPTHAASVNFAVTFSEPVTGVNTSDFTPTVTGSILGGITGASVSGVTGSGTTYTVTVNTGTGSGTLRLDVSDDDTIVDAAGNPLGGPGAGNGDFTSGEAYDVRFYRIYLPVVLRN